MYCFITKAHVRPLNSLQKVTIPKSGSAVIRTDFRMLGLLEGFRVVVASGLKDVDLLPENPVESEGNRYVGALDKDTPFHLLAVNNNSFDVQVNPEDDFGFIGMEEEDEPGWVESRVRPSTPRPSERELTIANAVLPDDVTALFDRYNLKDFDCTAIASEFFRKECLPEVFAMLKRRVWPFNSFDEEEFALAEILECIDMERLQELPNCCSELYPAEAVNSCLFALLHHMDVEETFSKR